MRKYLVLFFLLCFGLSYSQVKNVQMEASSDSIMTLLTKPVPPLGNIRQFVTMSEFSDTLANYYTGLWSRNGNDIHNNNSGNVAIGSMSASYPLQVTGTSGIIGAMFTTAGDCQFLIQANGGNEAEAKIRNDNQIWDITLNTGEDLAFVDVSHGLTVMRLSDINQTAHFNNNVNVTNTINVGGFTMATGAVNNYVLTSDGSGVGTWQTLPSDETGTDDQQLTADSLALLTKTIYTLTLEDGGTPIKIIDNVNDADTDSENEIQSLSTNGSAGNITISASNTLNINVDDADASTTNEIQDLSLSVNTLSLTGDATTVDLSGYLDNTDTQLTDEQVQDITGAMLTGNTETLITLTYQDSDGTIDAIVEDDLSLYDNSTSGFLNSEVDGSITNETNTSFLLNVNSLDLTDSNGTLSVDLSGYNDSDSIHWEQIASGVLDTKNDADVRIFNSTPLMQLWCQPSGDKLTLTDTLWQFSDQFGGIYTRFDAKKYEMQSNGSTYNMGIGSGSESTTYIFADTTRIEATNIGTGQHDYFKLSHNELLAHSNRDYYKLEFFDHDNVGFGTLASWRFYKDGKLRINADDANYYDLPSTDGTANQFIQTNGSGVLSWVDAPSGSDGNGIFDASNDGGVIPSVTGDYDIDVSNQDVTFTGTSGDSHIRKEGYRIDAGDIRVDGGLNLFVGTGVASDFNLGTLGSAHITLDHSESDINLSNYGSLTHTGTNAAFLAVEADGDIIEIDPATVGGASQLSDLTDVNTSTPTNRNALIADGVDFESRALEAADIQSGTFADARISQSSVTQHQAALSITESQISDLGSYITTSDIFQRSSGVISELNVGDDFNFDSNSLYVDASTNRIGIGTATPTTILDVVGNSQITGTLDVTSDFTARDAQFTRGAGTDAIFEMIGFSGGGLIGTDNNFPLLLRANNVEIMRIDTSNNVGINNQFPDRTLDVSGSMQVDGNTFNVDDTNNRVGIGTTSPIVELDIEGAINIGTTTNTTAGNIRYTGTDFEGYTGGSWNSLTSGGGSSEWTLSGVDLYPTTGQQIGTYGVTLPKSHLHTGQNAAVLQTAITDDIDSTGVYIVARQGNHDVLTYDNVLTLGRIGVGGNVWSGNAQFDLGRWEDSATSSRTQMNIALSHGGNEDATDIMSLRSDGKVGIGTTTPEHPLDIVGDVIMDGLRIGGSGTSNNIYVADNVSGQNIFYNNNYDLKFDLSNATADYIIETGGGSNIQAYIIDGDTGISTFSDASSNTTKINGSTVTLQDNGGDEFEITSNVGYIQLYNKSNGDLRIGTNNTLHTEFHEDGNATWHQGAFAQVYENTTTTCTDGSADVQITFDQVDFDQGNIIVDNTTDFDIEIEDSAIYEYIITGNFNNTAGIGELIMYKDDGVTNAAIADADASRPRFETGGEAEFSVKGYISFDAGDKISLYLSEEGTGDARVSDVRFSLRKVYNH